MYIPTILFFLLRTSSSLHLRSTFDSSDTNFQSATSQTNDVDRSQQQDINELNDLTSFSPSHKFESASSTTTADSDHVGWLPEPFLNANENPNPNPQNIEDDALSSTFKSAAGNALKRKRRAKSLRQLSGLDIQHRDGKGNPSNGWDPAARKEWNGMCVNGNFVATKDLAKAATPEDELKRFFVPSMQCALNDEDQPVPSCATDKSLCFFTPASGNEGYMLHWKGYCLQIDIPLGEYKK